MKEDEWGFNNAPIVSAMKNCAYRWSQRSR